MRWQEIIGKISWSLRYLDPMYIFFVIFLKYKKATPREQEEILRGIYDLRVWDPALQRQRREWVMRLAVISLLGAVAVFVGVYLLLVLIN